MIAIGMMVIYSLWWWCGCFNAYKNVTIFVVYWVGRINGSSLLFCRNYLIKIVFVNAVKQESCVCFSYCDCIVHSFVSSEHSGTDFWVVYDSWIEIVSLSFGASGIWAQYRRKKIQNKMWNGQQYEMLLIMECKTKKKTTTRNSSSLTRIENGFDYASVLRINGICFLPLLLLLLNN